MNTWHFRARRHMAISIAAGIFAALLIVGFFVLLFTAPIIEGIAAVILAIFLAFVSWVECREAQALRMKGNISERLRLRAPYQP